MSSSSTSSSVRLWTPANVVTMIRILLVPFFVVALLSPWPQWFGVDETITDSVKSYIAAGIFILISCTDWIDGYLARKRNEVSDFGKFVDPLADKILVTAALLALIELNVLPSWPVLIILTREFIVAGVRMLAASKGVVIAASWYGKAKTVTQIIAIILFLIKDGLVFPTAAAAFSSPLYDIAWLVMIIALVLTVLSMLDYLSKARFVFAETAEETDLAAQNEAKARAIILKATDVQKTIATAESLTGGLIAATLTAIPGSSSVVVGSLVTYTFGAKESLLGVDQKLLETQGAVNSQTALEMVTGASKRTGSDIAVSVTGIAGPGGAEPGKPVGTVWMGISALGHTKTWELHFEGDREEVRLATVGAALDVIIYVLDKGDLNWSPTR